MGQTAITASEQRKALRVWFTYYGRRYSGAVEALRRTRADVSWRLRDGRRITRSLHLVDHGVEVQGADADRLTTTETAFGSFAELLGPKGDHYSPTLLGEGAQIILANTYDRAQSRRGDARRAHRRTDRRSSGYRRQAWS